MLSNQAASRPPVGERVEIETQEAGLRPRSLNDDGLFPMLLMRFPRAERLDDRTNASVAKPIARERKPLSCDVTEAAAAGDLLQLRFLDA